jgi:sarcosine oxidase, subunit gamma
MMEVAQYRQSPLAAFDDEHQPANDPGAIVELVEHPFAGYFNLRLDCDDGESPGAVADALGMDLPVTPNRVVSGESLTIYWLGPDEWLLVTPSESGSGAIDALRERLRDTFHALTDVSSGMTRITVRGALAEDILRQGTPLDLHPRVFTRGQCAQTALAKTSVILSRRGEPAEGFDLIVRRSFADYLLRFLRDAAHEQGYSFARAPD